jgi:hypothetical protein
MTMQLASPTYATWLMIHQLDRLDLTTLTSIHKAENGDVFLRLYTGETEVDGEAVDDEFSIKLNTMMQARILQITVEEYVNFIKEHGRLSGLNRKSPQYTDHQFDDAGILPVVRKRLQQEELNETESLIFLNTQKFWFNALRFPPLAFTQDDVQDAITVTEQLLDVIPEISEETGFWYGARFTHYDNETRQFKQLDKVRTFISCDCSDFFEYATADSEDLTPENVHLYQESYAQVMEVAPEDWELHRSAIRVARLFSMKSRQEPLSEQRLARWKEPLVELFAQVSTGIRSQS